MWFMWSPHVSVLCLFAPQQGMTAPLELLKTPISNDYGNTKKGQSEGEEEKEKIKQNKY